MMKVKTMFCFLFLMLLVIGMNAYERGPVAVSPGNERGVAVVGQSCPTFSWTAVSWARGYKVVVFEAVSTEVLTYEEMETIMSPVMTEEIRGPALSWTPSADERLRNGGEYVWYVRAVDVSGIGVWSDGRMFNVEVAVRLAGVEEKVRERLMEYGVDEDVITEVFEDEQSELKEVVLWGVDTQGSQDRMRIQGTEGTDVTFYGSGAGTNNGANGDYNTFVGSLAGYTNIDGDNNTFVGHQAGYNSTASNNAFLGYQAGVSNTEGFGNIFVGSLAGYSNTTASSNIFIGYGAGYSSTTSGSGNCFIGREAGYSNTTGASNTFLSSFAGRNNTDGDYNTFLGQEAGRANSSGSYNTFLGCSAGYSNTSSNSNTFLGHHAGYSNTSGYQNTFVGDGAGYNETTGGTNTLIGMRAGYNNNTGNGNVFLGYWAGYNETGSYKLYIDNSPVSSPLIYGEFDNDILAINGKLGIGTQSPGATVEAEGTGSAVKFWLDRTDGATAEVVAKTNNITFGSRTNHGIQFSVNSITRMHIDTNGDVGLGVTDATYPLEMGGGAYCTGTNWVDVSSREYKENISDLGSEEAFEALEGLNPVRFNYKRNAEEDYVGFIAEDVPELVATKDRKGISTMDVVAVLTKVVQKQQNVIQEQKKNIQGQEEMNKKQQKIIMELLERIEALENKK